MHGTSRSPAYWKVRKANEVARECEALQTEIVLLHSAARNRDGQIRQLQLVIQQRNETIDQLRYANQKLHLENACLTALLIAPPQRSLS
jgi:hypothetical protein